GKTGEAASVSLSPSRIARFARTACGEGDLSAGEARLPVAVSARPWRPPRIPRRVVVRHRLARRPIRLPDHVLPRAAGRGEREPEPLQPAPAPARSRHPPRPNT